MTNPSWIDIGLRLVLAGLAGMLVVRHRKNFARIAAGTEPKVNLHKKTRPPSGRWMTMSSCSLARLSSACCGVFSPLAAAAMLLHHSCARRG